ncbi:CLUMA_CG014008, isoform A [Clunio marinus]|uniref:CLUMA_CG014008, isoform A n=1 Tax=Clunio marinus TaxID=568069 RepID=A0A1J1IKQ0_9DIPT|nr:CLUMA_CG014008, isoform A [Clunio marinus]
MKFCTAKHSLTKSDSESEFLHNPTLHFFSSSLLLPILRILCFEFYCQEGTQARIRHNSRI